MRHTVVVSRRGLEGVAQQFEGRVSKATKTPIDQPQTTMRSALVRSTWTVKSTVATTAITRVDRVTIWANSSGGVCMLRWGIQPRQNWISSWMPARAAKTRSETEKADEEGGGGRRGTPRTSGYQLTSSSA